SEFRVIELLRLSRRWPIGFGRRSWRLALSGHNAHYQAISVQVSFSGSLHVLRGNLTIRCQVSRQVTRLIQKSGKACQPTAAAASRFQIVNIAGLKSCARAVYFLTARLFCLEFFNLRINLLLDVIEALTGISCR